MSTAGTSIAAKLEDVEGTLRASINGNDKDREKDFERSESSTAETMAEKGRIKW